MNVSKEVYNRTPTKLQRPLKMGSPSIPTLMMLLELGSPSRVAARLSGTALKVTAGLPDLRARSAARPPPREWPTKSSWAFGYFCLRFSTTFFWFSRAIEDNNSKRNYHGFWIVWTWSLNAFADTLGVARIAPFATGDIVWRWIKWTTRTAWKQ